MGNKMGRALRRGVALGLVLAGAWGVSLTADFSGIGDRLDEPALAVSLLASQLGELPGREKGLTGWGRLLLKASPLLAAGEGAVLERRENQEAPGETGEPDLGDGEDTDLPDLQPSDSGEGIVEMTGRGKEGSRKRGTSLMISGDGAYPARPGEGGGP